MMTLRSPLAPVLVLGAIVAAATPHAARAGTVKGTVKLPEGARGTRLYSGYWRLENGNVPVQTNGGAKAEMVVVITNVNGAHPLPARTVTVEIGGLDARPRVVIVGPGSVIEIKNTGKSTHQLSTPAQPSLMPLEQLPPGAVRRQRFDAAGGYPIRDAEYPHIMISVIVADTPYYSTLDERGAFSVPNVPDGKAVLKVWARGRWAVEQEIDAAKKDDLTVKVAGPNEQNQAKETAE